MITPQKADIYAEACIALYADRCGVQSPEDIRKALELLISKSARAIEKYTGTPTAVDVLQRTALRLMPTEGQG